MIAEQVRGSFRDPSGHVYRSGNRIVRTITRSAAAQFEFVQNSGLFEQLVRDERLLSYAVVNEDIPTLFPGQDVQYLLETPRLPFISYPYEWSFPALKAAALLHLDIQLAALTKGVALSDATAYNVQFLGPHPIFIDHLSFRRYREGEVWAGHRQFCEQFLIPLLLRSLLGISHNAWYRGCLDGIPLEEFNRLLSWRHYVNRNLVTHIVMQAWLQLGLGANSGTAGQLKAAAVSLPMVAYRRLLDGLRAWIATLTPLGSHKSTWQDYARSNSYRTEDASLKRRFIQRFVSDAHPHEVWDLGCNAGDYSKAALEAGAEMVVGFDCDQGALEACYVRAVEERLNLLPLCLDVANPSPNQGWQEGERDGLQTRASADAVLALALIHHVVIARNVPLPHVLGWLLSLAPRGILEFVPKSDPMVQQLLHLREDIFPDYTFEACREYLCLHAVIREVCTISHTGRSLIWYERRGSSECR